MPLATRALQWSDIDDQLPSVQKLETFKRIVDFAIAEGARVLDTPSKAKPWLGILENFYWRAEDLYVLKAPDKKATPCDVYHPFAHYLFVRKYGKKLEGRPLSMLLAESIASMSEYELVLEALAEFGFGGLHEAGFIRSLIEFEVKRRGTAQGKPEVEVLRFLHTEVAHPYASFRRAALELFEFFRSLYEAGVGRTEGRMLDFADYIRRCEKLKYGALILRFNAGLNVADAIAYGGRISTDEDRQVVDDCLEKLKSSESYLDFLTELGLSEPVPAKAAG